MMSWVWWIEESKAVFESEIATDDDEYNIDD